MSSLSLAAGNEKDRAVLRFAQIACMMFCYFAILTHHVNGAMIEPSKAERRSAGGNTMEELLDGIKAAMIDTGRMTEKSRIKLVEITGDRNSDYRRVTIEVIKPRCHKPFMVWNLCVDIVRELLFWETSTFYYI